ncbi:MAG: ATP-binding protein [Bacteroides sp.]
MSTPRRLPLGTQAFDVLRKDGDFYVDKTSYIEKLQGLGRVFFLSRPHRFGKSLFLSTLKAYFEGKKELFEGLYIAAHEEEIARRRNREPWEASPVLYFDFNAKNYTDPNTLRTRIEVQLENLEALYEIEKKHEDPDDRFIYLVAKIYQKTKKRVVILIDEYDKPLLETLGNPELNEANRVLLRAFYEVLKQCDLYIRFAFLTGITKFSKTTLFSSVNNLKDITLHNDYAAICGFTEEELTQCFAFEIERLAEAEQCSVEKVRATLKKKYDGYCFARKGENIYNPFSLLNVLADSAYGYYWFESATPNYVVRYIRENAYPIENLEQGVTLACDEVQDFRYGTKSTIPLLFQSGYLTIKKYLPKHDDFVLGFPNEEVRNSFFKSLLPMYSDIEADELKRSTTRIQSALLSGDIATVIEWVTPVLAAIHYGNIPNSATGLHLREYYYQSVLYALFYVLGLQVQTEIACATGRIDMLISTRKRVYIFEFKTNVKGSAQDALDQIKTQGYPAKYRRGKRPIHLVGVSFDEKSRNIGEWAEEVLRADGPVGAMCAKMQITEARGDGAKGAQSVDS